MERIILAYCHENVGLANQIDEKLRRSGIRFDHVSDLQDKLPGQFVAAVQATSAPVVLLVTDNFLRRAECMSLALPMLQQLLRTNRVLPVIADGFRFNPETGRTERVETHFERVIHAIIYMNYWQSVYLELRQKKDHAASPEEAESVDRELRNVREISVEIGDFLNTLRNADHLSWASFSANQFELFFRRFGIPELYQKYRQLAANDPVPGDDETVSGEAGATRNAPGLIENLPKTIESEPVSRHFEESPVETAGRSESVFSEKPVDVHVEKEPVFEKKADSGRPNFWENPAGQPPEFVPEEEPFWAGNGLVEPPIFEQTGFDILAHLDPALDEKSALEAAKSRKKRLSAEPVPTQDKAVKPAPKSPAPKKGEGENGNYPFGETLVVSRKKKAGAKPESPVSAEKTVEKEPVEIELDRKLAPIPPSPTHAEIEALVAEIVREEAAKAEARAGFTEKPAAENGENRPVFGSENDFPTQGLAEKKPDVADANEREEPTSRPVSAMHLPHFQPVSANSSANDDIRITQSDAYFWLQKGDFDEARMQAEELTMKYPARAEGWFLLGEISEAAGDYLAARHFWEKTVLIDDEYPDAHLRLAKMLDHHFKTEKKEAVRHYRAAANNDPGDAASLYRAGAICLENLGKHEKARRFFQKTVEREPRHSAAWYDLAHLERHLGNFDEAAEAYEQAVKLDPALKTDIEAGLFVKKSFTTSRVSVEKPLEVLAGNTGFAEAEISGKEIQLSEKQPVSIEKPAILTVLITGATSGIGRATAEVFAKNGHRVIMTGRRAERLAELENDFAAHYKNDILTACFDVRDRQSVAQFVENLPENWRDIDLLINNAGLAKGLDPIHEADFAHWEAMIDTNLKGLLYMTRLVAPGMVARRRGHIINIGSIAGKEVYPKGGVYNATKFAVDALTRAMRLDLVPHGVKVSSVSPGHVEETEFALVRFDGNAERARIYDDFQPLSSHDVAEAIYFMATRPAHVAIHDIVLTGAQQASAVQVERSGR